MLTAKILVVDDEVGIRLYLEEILVRDGHQVLAVESGEQAVAILEQRSFDLALVDLKLKGMDGMEVLSAIRQQALDTVVIILTAHATLETAVEALRQGAVDYLFKPCKTVQLRESVRKGLQHRQRQLRQRSLLHQLEQHLSSELESIRATIAEQPSPYLLESVKIDETLPEALDSGGRFLERSGLIVDFSSHLITLDGCLLELSPTEFDLLAYLVTEAPRVVSPQELVREVQGYASEVWEARDTVRQHVYKIRQKIKDATGQTDDLIRTVRGVGYTVK
jgi:DNA-binding response OmpR family regulator